MAYLTTHERYLAHRYIAYSLARITLEHDLKAIDSFKIPELYGNLITTALDQISLHLRDIKREMKRLGLRVADGQEHGHYMLICRGYTEQTNFTAPILRVKVFDVLIEVFRSKTKKTPC